MAPLKGVPVVAGGAVVPGGAVVGGGAFVAGPPTEMVRPETHCSDYVLSRSKKTNLVPIKLILVKDKAIKDNLMS